MPAVVKLNEIASARSSAAADDIAISVVANNSQCYAFLQQTLTAGKVESFFAGVGMKSVSRSELDNLQTLHFVLENALGENGAASLKLDAAGVMLGTALEELVLRKPE